MSTPEKQKPRLLKASPFGRGGIAQAMTERASPSPESRRTAINCLFGKAMLSLRLHILASILALSVTFGDSSPKGRALDKEGRLCGMQKPLPLGEPKSVRSSPFTQETGRFAQVFLIFPPQMWYIQDNQMFPVFTIYFHHSKEVFVCCLIVSLRCVFWVGLSIRGG